MTFSVHAWSLLLPYDQLFQRNLFSQRSQCRKLWWSSAGVLSCWTFHSSLKGTVSVGWKYSAIRCKLSAYILTSVVTSALFLIWRVDDQEYTPTTSKVFMFVEIRLNWNFDIDNRWCFCSLNFHFVTYFTKIYTQIWQWWNYSTKWHS
jgi:hypothetical protein